MNPAGQKLYNLLNGTMSPERYDTLPVIIDMVQFYQIATQACPPDTPPDISDVMRNGLSYWKSYLESMIAVAWIDPDRKPEIIAALEKFLNPDGRLAIAAPVETIFIHNPMTNWDIAQHMVRADDIWRKGPSMEIDKILDRLLAAIPGETEPPQHRDTHAGKRCRELGQIFSMAMSDRTLGEWDVISKVQAIING